MRQVCVSEESSTHGEEACRYESIKDVPGFNIVRSHDDMKYFCQGQNKFLVGAAAADTPELDDKGEFTEDAKKKY